jgi:hypothetical protein
MSSVTETGYRRQGGRKLSAEMRDQMMVDYSNGMKIKEIAEKYGVDQCYPAVLARRYGLPVRRTRIWTGNRPPNYAETIITLWNKGVKIKEIAEVVSAHPGSVQKLARRYGCARRYAQKIAP